MVEFAACALVFLMIMFGIIDFGRAAFEYNMLASSAREGARTAVMQSYTNTDVINRTVQSSAGILKSSDVTISGTRTCNTVPCSTVTVTVTHTFTPVTPLVRTMIGGSGTISMSAASTMVVER